MNREAGADVSPGVPAGGAPEEEFDLRRLKELGGFLLRSPRRRPRLTLVVFLVTLGFGLIVAAYWPRTFGAEARILAQHNLVLPALDNPGRSVPREADNPTKNAADQIKKRDNVVALVKQLDLIDRWDATRQPVLRLKDKILAPFSGGPKPEEDRLLDLVGFLDKRLVVGTDESSINISIEWPDREMAYEIVALVLKNFLEARYDTNVNVITEAIRILEERAKPQSDEVDAALAELSKAEANRRSKISSISASSPRVSTRAAPRYSATSQALPAPTGSASASPGGGSVDDTDITAQLEEVRHRLREVEDDRRRRLTDAQNQLADARTTLGPMHPTVVGLSEKIADLSVPPPELVALRARERDLVGKIAKAAVPAPASPPAPTPVTGSPRSRPPSNAPASEPSSDLDLSGTPLGVRDSLVELMRDDPETALARSKLQAASTKYNELLSRIEAASIELDVTRASFKYQYTVVRPPELARKPTRPNVPLVVLASFLAAFLLMMLIPGGLDLIRGRFVEAWQVERELGLPLLGELTPPR
jgi:uncharacterized protein involved in exopolysaccharide biosynthesis